MTETVENPTTLESGPETTPEVKPFPKRSFTFTITSEGFSMSIMEEGKETVETSFAVPSEIMNPLNEALPEAWEESVKAFEELNKPENKEALETIIAIKTREALAKETLKKTSFGSIFSG